MPFLKSSPPAPSFFDSSLNSEALDFVKSLESLEEGLKGLPSPASPRPSSIPSPVPFSIGTDFYRDLGEILDRFLPPLHKAYDRYVAKVLQSEDRRITCKSGCSACCRHFVTSVEPFEILAIHLRIRNSAHYADLLFACHGRASQFERILQAEGEDGEAEDRALYRYFVRGAACPFLGKEGTCRIYDLRPMSCRMFFSESSPRFCTGTALASPWNRNFQVELPEAAEEALARCSALLAHLELPEGLFSGVLEANAIFGQYDGKEM